MVEKRHGIARVAPLHHAIRGIVSVWIALAHLLFNPVYHAGFADYRDLGWAALPLRFDYVGVDFFFLLSGCLLTLNYRTLFEDPATGSKQIDRFYLQRLARIYPLHLVMLAFIFVTACLGVDWPKTAGHWAWLWDHRGITLAANLALVHAWGILPAAAWNEPAWTISIFALLYVLFPNLIFLTRRLPDRACWPIIGLLIGGYALQRQLYPTGGQSDGMGAIIRGLCFFTTGLCIARLHQAKWRTDWPWTRIFYLLLLLSAAMLVLWANHPFEMGWFHALYPLFLLASLRATVPWLQRAPFHWAGSRSYTLYMVHYPVMVLVGQWPGTPFAALPELVAYPLFLLLLFAVVELVYRTVERPCSRWAKHRLKAL